MEASLRIGLVADLHYAEKPPAIGRYYRESLAKLSEAVKVFNDRQVHLAVELGDFIDSTEQDAENLTAIDAAFKQVRAERFYVLGNHCVERLSKREFLAICGQRRSFFSVERNGVHLAFLDGCYRKDGVSYDQGHYEWTDCDIPPDQQRWLEEDLKGAESRAIVFVHQRLDDREGSSYAIASSAAIRKILEDSGKVLAVFQGHYHKGDHKVINGIRYCTLPAMCDGSGDTNNGYSILSVFADGSLRMEGFRKHANHPAVIQRP